MIWVVVPMVSLLLWERPHLRMWPSGERAAFWVFWTLVLAWAVAAELHMQEPTINDLTERLCRGGARRLLTPGPHIIW